VRYTNVYPGVDLVYYGKQRQLEYDFVIQPGADPSDLVGNFVGNRRSAWTNDDADRPVPYSPPYYVLRRFDPRCVAIAIGKGHDADRASARIL
jgi:hypothetical protein